jgi:hypothetical protein
VFQLNPRLKLVLAGARVARSFEDSLQSYVRSLGLANQVVLVPEPFELSPRAGSALMSCADVFLHLSTGVEETSSRVILEAMAHAVVPVCSDWSGHSELVEHGETGFLIPSFACGPPPSVAGQYLGLDASVQAGLLARGAGISGTAVAAALEQLLNNTNLARKLGHAARQRVETTLNERAVVKQRLQFISDCIHNARRVPQRRSPHPLVDLQTIAPTLATGPLLRESFVRAIALQNAALAPPLSSMVAPAVVTELFAALTRTPRVRAGDLFEQVAAAVGATNGDGWATFCIVIARWASAGIVSLEPSARSPEQQDYP